MMEMAWRLAEANPNRIVFPTPKAQIPAYSKATSKKRSKPKEVRSGHPGSHREMPASHLYAVATLPTVKMLGGQMTCVPNQSQ